MSKYRLTISFELEEGEDEESVKRLVENVQCFLSEHFEKDEYWFNKARVTLIRGEDRSAKNLLLPKLEGRVGNHLQSRKAILKEVLK